MKVAFFLKYDEHPYNVEFLQSKTKGLNNKHYYYNCIEISENLDFKTLISHIDFFIKQLCDKHPYINKENVLYKFVENNYYG